MNEEYQNALPQGTVLDTYRIERVLGVGGFGITYLAHELNLGKSYAIKELLPEGVAIRQSGDTSVMARSTSCQSDFDALRERFIVEARVLAALKHPAVVGVHRLVEAHGTCYMVMDYVEGDTLGDFLKKQNGVIKSRSEFEQIFYPLMDGLEVLHEQGLVHRDVKPGNIMVMPDGNPVLLDFGAVSQVQSKTMTVTQMVSAGYSPFEQYTSKARQGAYTDIYSLGATMVRAITGKKPDDASDRVYNDDYQPLVDTPSYLAEYGKPILAAVDAAMQMNAKDRPQTIAAWRKMLKVEDEDEVAVKAPVNPKRSSSTSASVTPDQTKRKASSPPPVPPADFDSDEPETDSGNSDTFAPENSSKKPKLGKKSLWLGMGVASVVLVGLIITALTGWLDTPGDEGEKPEPVIAHTADVIEKGSVLIESHPSGAHLYQDENYIGEAPFQMKHVAGGAQFRLKMDGYDDLTLRGQVEPNQELVLRGTLKVGRLQVAVNDATGLATLGKEGILGLDVLPKNFFSRVDERNLKLAALGGDSQAMFLWGYAHDTKNDLFNDDQEAFKWILMASDKKHIAAQATAGWMYSKGKGTDKNMAEAVRLTELAAEQGSARAQSNLGFYYGRGEGPLAKSETEAVKWFSKAAEQGYANAQKNLGVYSEGGKGGLPKRETVAVKWYHKAAEQGNVEAQFNLGIAYAYGKGVVKNEEKAVEWYIKAAEQGAAGGQYQLGVYHELGKGGLAKNEREAVKWYRRAAEQGHGDAQNDLGLAYENGQGIAKNEMEAEKWYRKSAERGGAVAQYNLARFFENGLAGLPRSKVLAKEWYRKSADQGVEYAEKALQLMD